jgi:hypothetical protein
MSEPSPAHAAAAARNHGSLQPSQTAAASHQGIEGWLLSIATWLEITHMLRWPLAALAVHLLQLHDLQPPREIGRAHGLHAVGGAGRPARQCRDRHRRRAGGTSQPKHKMGETTGERTERCNGCPGCVTAVTAVTAGAPGGGRTPPPPRRSRCAPRTRAARPPRRTPWMPRRGPEPPPVKRWRSRDRAIIGLIITHRWQQQSSEEARVLHAHAREGRGRKRERGGGGRERERERR